jgi:hypothetical protein
LWLLVPTFLLRNAPAWVTPSPSQQIRILSYRLQASYRIGFKKSDERILIKNNSTTPILEWSARPDSNWQHLV